MTLLWNPNCPYLGVPTCSQSGEGHYKWHRWRLTHERNRSHPGHILIADDQPDVLEALRLLLKGHGYVTEAVTSPAALIDAIARREFDLVLMDLNYARDTTSGREGLDVLSKLKASETAPPIVVMTGWATVGLAVEAMQRGVGDFVEKPWVNARLLEILQKQVDIGRERRTARRSAMERDRTQSEIASRLTGKGAKLKKRARSNSDSYPRKFRRLQVTKSREPGSRRAL